MAPNRLASANTSAGPARSSSFMPSNTTIVMSRSSDMPSGSQTRAGPYVRICGIDGRLTSLTGELRAHRLGGNGVPPDTSHIR
ncbi:Uncharacterised protein [Mycobacteroides abscessus subsp. abscessus]|nr:Uncharacterised protein [Mycobacteroides abscessus subsp. abscessus]